MSSFTLHLPDLLGKKQPGADSDPGDTAIICIPGRFQSLTEISPEKQASDWTKEQEKNAVLKCFMVEAVHWITKYHVGRSDAARMGLMGPASVDATNVSWPGMALPAMRDRDFRWTDEGWETEYEIPHWELGYLNTGLGPMLEPGYGKSSGEESGEESEL